MSYLGKHGTRATPQGEQLPGRPDQVKNTAGGFVWESDPWQRLNRFLILGSEGGSYYASERTLTTENVQCVRECIAADGGRTVDAIVDISISGRAVKNDPALYALAACIALGDKSTRSAAAEALPGVARTGTHLYRFVEYAESMRGWGRTLRWAVQNWYTRDPDWVALQAIKYRQRDGWSHRDLLRLAHPKSADEDLGGIWDWIAHPSHEGMAKHALIAAYEAAQHPSCTPAQAAALIITHRLPREALKTEHLTEPVVWRALLDAGMPIHAAVRNLPTMTRLGILESKTYRDLVVGALGDANKILRSRLHPMTLLVALSIYARGYGMHTTSRERGWHPLPAVIDALDEAFYMAFPNAEPSGKPTMVAVDVSGSMAQGSVAGSPLTPRQAAAALVLVAMHTEPEVACVGISNGCYALSISKRQRLDDVARHLGTFPASSTDLSLPYTAAIENLDAGWKPEVFQVLTDSETWHGGIHPVQALKVYRERSGVQARSIGVAMVANKWSMHDPQDPLTLDCVGFDTMTPAIMAEFSAGRL